MYPRYDDILSRIAEPPTWWSHGVPRYSSYSPRVAQIYGGEALLVRIACQGCWTLYDVALAGSGRNGSLRDNVDLWSDLPVGDPPNACCDGTHMQAFVLQVLQFWDFTKPGHLLEGVRDAEYEVYLKDALDDRSPLKNEAASMPVALSIYDRAEKHGLLDAWDVIYNDKPYDRRFLVDFLRAAGLKRAETLAANWIAKKQREAKAP